jgi:serine/threonine protein kinase
MNIIGKTIANRYEIISQTGVGGMATVYTARDNVLNRKVAIKVLKDEFTTDEEFVKRFNSEAQAAASLSHPNIVSIYDVGNEDGIYYIVMELVRGKTLKQIITEEGALPWKWSVNIAMQIASALETAHKNNIVHRDIKPHNIIITEDGVAKVTDFGIAKAVSNSTITAFGTTIGSVHYFSPEQAKGGYTDAKSDIYSLGVVMYEMLTGRVPFDSDTSVSVALKHMQEPPVPPMEINDNIPQAVNDIILKAMEKEPMARYQTATAMMRDLSRALKDPEGEFVEEENLDDGLTRRMGAITDDMLKQSATANKKKKQKKGIAKFFEEHPKAKGPIIVLICLILFVASIAVTSAILSANEAKDVQIPNLIGKTEEEAKAELKELKLNYEKVSEDYNADQEAGKIYEQSPAYTPNYKVKEKSTTIKVKVSKGTEKVTVPKVAGMTYDEAVKELENNKLKAEKIEETSKEIKEGIVISQETNPNTEANAGETVKIHVSIGTGIAQVVMPSVLGKTESDARQTLEGKNLKVNVEYSEDTTKDNGIVLSQNIKSGENIDEGTEITITVNKLAETKEAKITINVKSITGGYETKTEQGNTTTSGTTVKEKKLTVKVGEDKVYDKKVDLNSTAIQTNISGKGTVTVKVYIDDILKAQKDINLNTTSSYTFE